MKKILITGASGLLGKAVLRRLKDKKEYQIYAVTTRAERLADYPYVNVVECNLEVEEQRKEMLNAIRPDILIHMAWNQANEGFRMSVTNLQWLDISMSLLLLFEQNGGSKFMFAGSSSEYDGTEGVFTEETDITPASLYGLCKKTFNEFALEYCRVRNMEYIGMRLFTIYGPEDEHSFGAIPSAFRALKNNEKLVCNSPNTTRDYIYADDAANVAIQLMEHSFAGIINVASGKARSMREVFEHIGQVMDKTQNVEMSKTSDAGKRFEADITLMKSLGIVGYDSDFDKNIRKCNK